MCRALLAIVHALALDEDPKLGGEVGVIHALGAGGEGAPALGDSGGDGVQHVLGLVVGCGVW